MDGVPDKQRDVSCSDDAFIESGMCVSCAGRYGEGCWTCDETTCRDCGDERVLENGLCRVGDQCTKTDGMSCVECADGFINFKATDCALTDECVHNEDGACVQCVGEHIAPINGTCEVEEHCVAWHEDRRKRCEPGMCLSENKCVRWSCVTYEERRTSACRATRRRGCTCRRTCA